MKYQLLLLVAIFLSSVVGPPVPVFASVAQVLDVLRRSPFWTQMTGSAPKYRDKKLQTAYEHLLGQLVNLSMGDEIPKPDDVENLVGTIADVLIQSPDLDKIIDLSFITAKQIELMFEGKLQKFTFPGFTRNHAEKLVGKIMQIMARAALDLKMGRTVPDAYRILIPKEKIPKKLVYKWVMGDDTLPYLSKPESDALKDYYFGIEAGIIAIVNGTAVPLENYTISEDHRELIKKITKFLPENFNLLKIPKSVLQNLLNGKAPEYSQLPKELQKHFQENIDRYVREFGDKIDITDEKSLPTFEKISLPTYQPYDINKLEHGRLKQISDEDASNVLKLVGICVSALGFVTIVILFLLCKRQRAKVLIEDTLPQSTSTPISASPNTSRRDISHDE
uniref:Uncharacterized protein n=1 Tax=Steinernema glaseri TaxID=37863 RepID=A0A1I7XXL0_9BILA